ncbi:MAG TPA: ATP-dependent DNA helicase RecG, partial [Tepidisphaeraceae bacterium]|nr:ATP-dependent DNA helicase RecG [Tepidisphaeraceae bacterium]
MAESTPTVPPPLDRPIDTLEGIGPTRAREFRALNVHTLGDLLEYFPRDYQYERSECPIAQLVPDAIQIARGEIVACDYVSFGRRRFGATLQDPTGKLSLTWFNGAYLRRLIHPGMILRVQGRVKFFRGIPQIAQAKWEAIEPEADPVGEDLLRAVYPATAKLSSSFIWQVLDKNLDAALAGVEELFSPALLAKRSLLGRKQAFRAIHQPTNWNEAAAARRRLVYDELMLMQIGLILSRRLRGGRITAPVMRIDKLLDERIRRRFPFAMTNAQQRSVWEIVKNLQESRPMSRLLQGDVGSGKTIVALYAMLVVVANKLQSALLAPTEVLAEQHYLTLTNLLRESNVSIELFTSRTKRESKGSLAKHLADGRIHIAIGTQALLQEDVEFANLGLVVVDEQHKLGVRQRAVLKGKGFAPHYLVMTATPIPRTLALSYFADFDVSVLDELPPGRQPIKTRWLRNHQADEAYRFVRQQVAAGRQAYIVVPQIDDDGLEEAKSVKTQYDRLSQGPLAGLKLAILHGQMSTDEKQKTMTAFRDRQIDVLIAT